MKGKYLVLALSIFGLFLMATSAFAATAPGGAEISNEVDLGEYVVHAAESVDVEAGNITYANLYANVSTYRWAAIIGNVTGNIVLADGANEQLYLWTAAGRVVYASTAANPDWGSLVDADAATVEAEFTWLADSSDDYQATFAGSEVLDSELFTIAAGDFVDTYSDDGTPTWRTFSLWDGVDDVVFAAEVQEDGEAYDGDEVDFQMLVPEDGEAENSAVTAYYLWVELQ